MTPTPWYLYVAFIGFVLGMLALDLRFSKSKERESGLKQSAIWTVVWIGLAIAFGFGLLAVRGGEAGAAYFAGWLVEKSLSVDNMFVFVLVFSYFRVPLAYQHRVLFLGILGAIVFRGIFIALGVALIQSFEWILYLFGALLIVTALRIAFGKTEIHPENNRIVRFFERRSLMTPRYHGSKLFVIEAGKRVATPLLVCLAVIETTDILFAVDSIPAIFAITTDPFIILTSNVFAILGLRSLYFLLVGSIERLHLLKYGLSVILAFVGVKMLGGVVDIHISTWVSLGVIAAVLGVTAFLSLAIYPPRKSEDEQDELSPPPGGTGALFEKERTPR
ncbi:MAG: TerC family protein [Actinomycetota bacterium]